MKRLAACLMLFAAACEGPLQREAAPEAPDASPPQSKCVARRAPESIADMVALLNALPKPVTLPCVLEALPHPLSINAANSVLSAQPAVGKRSPRIFLFLNDLMLSVVPAGMGSRLLEFGERRSDTHTLKAELEFPIETELDSGSPYTRLPFEGASNSSCGFCHIEQEQAQDVGHAYARISHAIRPMPAQRVSLVELQAELANCDAAQEPERCAMLEAIFGPNRKALDAEFPKQWKTFF